MDEQHKQILDGISSLLEEASKSNEEKTARQGVFLVKTANASLKDSKQQKDPRSLWKTFWYEGEICCLFSDSNLGKSIYAVQIAAHIAESEKVLYFDFELSEKQFQLRYTNERTGELHVFSDNLYRVEIDCEKLDPFTFEETVVEEIVQVALRVHSKIVIIDNLTYLCSAMEKAEAAGTLMKQLISAKKIYGFSFLILAHTPKRPLWAPITQNDLQGSKRLFNLFDSVFAIGQSAIDEELRYIKELKVRWGKKTYGEKNVIIAKIDKQETMLKFLETGCANEAEHLKLTAEETREEMVKVIKGLRKEGNSIREIAKQLSIPKSTVEDYLKKQG